MPRHDGKLSIHILDLDNFDRECDKKFLPWEAVIPMDPGDEHPEALDQRLYDALNARALDSDMQTPWSHSGVPVFV
jgi:hypothetical protein